MPRLHGRNGTVYLQGSGAEAVLLSQSADWTLDTDHDIVDVPALGDSWVARVRGMNKWSGSIDGSVDTTQSVPWDSMAATTSRKFYLYMDKSAPTLYYYGLCWPKLSLKGGVSSAITFSMSLDGDQDLTPKP